MAEITAQQVKELRDKSGAGMMDCKKALGETDGDMKKAMNLLRERGAAIASKRASRAAKEGTITVAVSPDHKRASLAELNSESDFVARNDDFQGLAQGLADHINKLDDLSDVQNSKMECGQSVADAVQGIVGKIGEKIIFTNYARLEAAQNGYIFHYIHPPGKIGVLVEVIASKATDSPELEEFARDIAMHIAATAPLCVNRDEVPSDALENERQIFRNQALAEGKPAAIVDKIIEGRVQKFYGESVLLEQPFAKNPDIKVSEYVKQNTDKFGDDVAVTRFVRIRLGEKSEDPTPAADAPATA
ncbi:elongation factor Ts [candidate division BRC1 bacterium HGW-BRC1-1]|jgi:elongation factor Ts|nr:MAG: elongation factor Ts [candidate division BRC1 bacterium HGW-BRC1-1]